jgi:hypothetical protein
MPAEKIGFANRQRTAGEVSLEAMNLNVTGRQLSGPLQGFAHRMEDAFWPGTLGNLARYAGVSAPQVTQQMTRVDNKVPWRVAKNVWPISAIRSTLSMPIHLGKCLFR